MAINYTVYYKLPKQFFWRKLKNVKADLLMTDQNPQMRVFILDNEERIEIPINHLFKFSKERYYAITNAEKEKVGI